ncbi:pathogenicity island protein [Mammaliicoccus sciuri]|nr:pathogenicity island protein [Mammaliicoccus sciuri]MCJ0913164.1 pathogenicity island protein [Mammaliicoccus sciuri]MCJ0918574.1 pathogenicity island protein [Mammaliicoccus sciuri]MCJ0961406.1 pathogenicity island protein [Mammaliicoccus sciuri]MCJ1764309.1 pathogenicity island protein [Mammaliicoccus sciuri]MCJ1773092.1 pathogenicity island protein [Mammaliicoccus sciuri]
MQATKINYDTQARKIGLIVGISEEIYFCTLSRVSTVYVEKIGDHWLAWRETYILNSKRISNYKILAQGSFELVMARTNNYIQFIKKKR